MDSTVKQIVAPHHLEYVTLDRQWLILEASEKAYQFGEIATEVAVGHDIRNSFPELIGAEEILTDILDGRQAGFEIKAITRQLKNEHRLYFDLFIVQLKTQDISEQLVIFFANVTDRMALEQTLVQATNEMNLLLSTLAKTKDYIEKIITSMAEVLLVTSASGKIKKVNEAAQILFGYQEFELFNQPISLLIPDWKSLQQLSQLSSSSQTNVEIHCTSKTGDKLSVSFSCSAIPSETTDLGSEQDLVIIGRDITQRQRTQQRQLVQYVTTLLLSELSTFKEVVGEILPVFCDTLEWEVGEFWTSEECPQDPLQSSANCSQLRCEEIWIKPSISLPKFIETTKQIRLTKGEGLPGRIWQNASCQWISDVATDPIFTRREVAAAVGLHGAFGFPILGDYEETSEGRAVLGIMTFFSSSIQHPDEDLLQAMTAIGSQIGQFVKRKQAEDALRESEERLRDLFENASDLIQSVSIEGCFLYVNRTWRETLGYSESDLKTLTVFDIIHPDCREHCAEIFQCVFSGQKIDHVQAEFITKDGRKISVEGNINCKYAEGKPVATRAIFRDITERLRSEAALHLEREKSERLLLNILPQPIAERLKQEEKTIADDFGEVTVMFADLVGFTPLSSSMNPIELVGLLNEIFSAFDRLCEQHGLEKIKTIGDAYMVVGGLPKPRLDHAQAIAEMALDMQKEIIKFNQKNHKKFSIRIGIHSGPVVAGVIGIKKFIYDLWGDTVNMASRMESHGLPGQIQVSEFTYNLIKEKFILEERGLIQVKGKGEIKTYLLLQRRVDTKI